MYKCVCGKTFQKSLAAFQLCPSCDECISNNYKEILKTSYEEVKSFFTDKGCLLLSTEYKGISEPLDYICSCGSADVKTFAAFKATSECPKCWIQKRSGENNWRWNPNLTDAEREENKSRASLPEQKKWKLAVYKRDKYLCQCCGKRSTRKNPINAHHLDGYNWCIERRTDVTNGVTLCQNCHTDFHSEHGYGYNTLTQYNEWIRIKRNQDAI
jgi:hypothetical protein